MIDAINQTAVCGWIRAFVNEIQIRKVKYISEYILGDENIYNALNTSDSSGKRKGV